MWQHSSTRRRSPQENLLHLDTKCNAPRGRKKQIPIEAVVTATGKQIIEAISHTHLTDIRFLERISKKKQRPLKKGERCSLIELVKSNYTVYC